MVEKERKKGQKWASHSKSSLISVYYWDEDGGGKAHKKLQYWGEADNFNKRGTPSKVATDY